MKLLLLTFSILLGCTNTTTNTPPTIITSIKEKPRDYSEIKANTEKRRAIYQEEYNNSSSEKKDSIIYEAQSFLLADIDSYFDAWYGTQWSFEGHTRTPQDGHIACGYFVTTVLLDMGFDIPRIKWAQMASEEMIKNMTSDIKRFQKAPMNTVVEYIREKGEGLYVVGLDCHVGFIYYNKNEIRFVHSNYYRPSVGVMSEPLIGKNPLNDSKYRVIGKIFDDNMVRKWITKSKFVSK